MVRLINWPSGSILHCSNGLVAANQLTNNETELYTVQHLQATILNGPQLILSFGIEHRRYFNGLTAVLGG